MTKWSMSGVSLCSIRNVCIYRAHWAIQKMYIVGGNVKKKHGKGELNALRVQKLQSKRRLAHHDTAVADEGGRG